MFNNYDIDPQKNRKINSTNSINCKVGFTEKVIIIIYYMY